MRTLFSGALRVPAALLLLGHLALVSALFATNGGEGLVGAILVLLALLAWGKAFQGLLHRAPAGVDSAVRVAWAVVLVSTAVPPAVAFIRPPGIYLEESVVPFMFLQGAAALILASYGLDVLASRVLPRSVLVGRRIGLFLLALAIGAWMLHASPSPRIDVFALHQQAARAMLEGKSIYAAGAIHTVDTHQPDHIVDFYPYFPLGACFTTLAYAATHDVRWAQLVAQLVGGLLMWIAARWSAPANRSPSREAWADLVAATFLFHPRGAFVLEQAWMEPLAIPFLGAFVLFVLAKRPILASVSLGLLCALKQHLVFFVPFLAFAPGVGITGVFLAGFVSVAVLAPFVIASPAGFYRGAVTKLVHYSLRSDGLNVSSELARVGIITPSWVGFVGLVVPLAWLGRIPRELGPLLLAATLGFGLFFVFGRQAFCNYYYMLDGTALLATATLTD